MKTKSVRTPFVLALLATLWLANFGSQYSNMFSQTNLQQPTVRRLGVGTIQWNAGTINNGGHAVSITAGTTSVTLDRTTCAAPLFSSCNIVYASSGGTVSVTAASNAITVAMGAGNTILAFIETSVTDISRVVYPQQTSIANKYPLTAVDCGITVTCASGASGNYVGPVIIAYGTAATVAGVAAVTGLPFTDSGSYGCVASLGATTSGTATGVSAVPASGSTMNATINPAITGITTAIQFFCFGT